jgi:hypothetical protein
MDMRFENLKRQFANVANQDLFELDAFLDMGKVARDIEDEVRRVAAADKVQGTLLANEAKKFFSDQNYDGNALAIINERFKTNSTKHFKEIIHRMVGEISLKMDQY